MLKGKKVLVTRAKEQSGPLIQLLEKYGATVNCFPTIEIVKSADTTSLEAALNQPFTGLIFTSGNGARIFFEHYKNLPSNIKIFVVGPNTRKIVEHCGYKVQFVPQSFKASDLARELPFDHKDHFLIPQSNISRNDLFDGLQERGVSFECHNLYTTRSKIHKTTDLNMNSFDWVTFTSGSTVEGFLKNKISINKSCKIASIGPSTSQMLFEKGLSPFVEAQPHTIEGLVQAMDKY